MSPEYYLIASGCVLTAILLFWIFTKRTKTCIFFLAALVVAMQLIDFHKGKLWQEKPVPVAVSDLPTLQNLKVGLYEYHMSFLDDDGSNIVMLYPAQLKIVDVGNHAIVAVRTSADPLMVRIRYVFGLETNGSPANLMVVSKNRGTNIISVFDPLVSSVAQVN